MDEFRLLGPLEAVLGGRPVALPAEKPRALLALLLLSRNAVVPTEQLVDGLWGDRPPARATKTLQVYVSQLRKALGPDRVLTRAPGYELRVAEGELDLDRFAMLAAAARERLAGGDPEGAAAGLREALSLWRGPPLREFRAEPFAAGAEARLGELRVAAVEDRVEAELLAGARGLEHELEALVAEEPLRERPRELLMLALYRAGRQADALALYRSTRALFVEELGIEPGPRLQELEGRILRQDPGLHAAAPPLPRRPAEANASRPPAGRRRGIVIAAAVGLSAAAVAAVLAVAGVGGGNGGAPSPPPAPGADPELASFVVKVENFLGQSRTARTEIADAVGAALRCELPPRRAADRLVRVQRSRQSLLQQLAALRVPPGEPALSASDLLQRAAQASIAADWRYRDWLLEQQACPRGATLPASVRRADARATTLKRRFLSAFDPLARRFHQRVWHAEEF